MRHREKWGALLALLCACLLPLGCASSDEDAQAPVVAAQAPAAGRVTLSLDLGDLVALAGPQGDPPAGPAAEPPQASAGPQGAEPAADLGTLTLDVQMGSAPPEPATPPAGDDTDRGGLHWAVWALLAAAVVLAAWGASLRLRRPSSKGVRPHPPPPAPPRPK